MKQSTVISTEPKSETLDKPKQPYSPPKFTFVPLKLEERLLSCSKIKQGCAAHTRQNS